MSTSSELRLTNNKEEDIIKVTKSLEGRGILLKGATKKINNQKGRLLIFFITIRINGSCVSSWSRYSKIIFGSGTTLLFSNEELDDIMKIDDSLKGSVYW